MAFFDHTHNLPLQFAVELGLPLALLVLGRCWRGRAVARLAPSARQEPTCDQRRPRAAP